MIQIEAIDPAEKNKIQSFVDLPFRLYKGCPQWVPPFISDIKIMFDHKKHPFYEHSDAEFFMALRDGEVVGRIAVLENRPFNKYHETKQASFCLFDTIDDQEVADALFNRIFDWARARGLNRVVGMKGLAALDGYGIQIEGFEHRQMMNMMSYNFPYYQKLVEAIGFTKEVDFLSCYTSVESFHLPEKVHEVARRVVERGTFSVMNFRNKRHLLSQAKQLGELYNKVFMNNWEYYPLSEREVKFVVDNVMLVADPKYIKFICHKEEIVGFLLAFSDISAAMQRQKGRITPWGVIDMFLEMRRTNWISMNGAGILAEFHGMGGNALLYSEMEKTVTDSQFIHVDMPQVADTAVQMRRDLKNVNGKPYKVHRVFQKNI